MAAVASRSLSSRLAPCESPRPARPDFFGPNPRIGVDRPAVSSSSVSLPTPRSARNVSEPKQTAESIGVASAQLLTDERLLLRLQQDVAELQQLRMEGSEVASLRQLVMQTRQDVAELQQFRTEGSEVASLQETVMQLRQDVAELQRPKAIDDQVVAMQQLMAELQQDMAQLQQPRAGDGIDADMKHLLVQLQQDMAELQRQRTEDNQAFSAKVLETNSASQELTITQLQLDVAEIKSIQRNKDSELPVRFGQQTLEARISEDQLQDLLVRSSKQDQHEASLRAELAQFEVRLSILGREVASSQEAQRQTARLLSEQEVKREAANFAEAASLEQVKALIAIERLAREQLQAKSHTMITEEAASRRLMCEELRASIDEHGRQALTRSIGELAPEMHAEVQRALDSFNAEVKTWLDARLEEQRQANAAHWDSLQRQIEEQEKRMVVICHDQLQEEAGKARKAIEKDQSMTRASIAAHTELVNMQIGDLTALIQKKPPPSGKGALPEGKLKEMVSQVDHSLRAELARMAFDCSALRAAVEQLDRKIGHDSAPLSARAPTELRESLLREVQQCMARHEASQASALQEVSRRLDLTRDFFDDSVRRLSETLGAQKYQQPPSRGLQPSPVSTHSAPRSTGSLSPWETPGMTPRDELIGSRSPWTSTRTGVSEVAVWQGTGRVSAQGAS